ncbi:hypothetical protein [Enterococcus hirae]|nr:hypothetical protein [Enterococcus hirae]
MAYFLHLKSRNQNKNQMKIAKKQLTFAALMGTSQTKIGFY